MSNKQNKKKTRKWITCWIHGYFSHGRVDLDWKVENLEKPINEKTTIRLTNRPTKNQKNNRIVSSDKNHISCLDYLTSAETPVVIYRHLFTVNLVLSDLATLLGSNSIQAKMYSKLIKRQFIFLVFVSISRVLARIPYGRSRGQPAIEKKDSSITITIFLVMV